MKEGKINQKKCHKVGKTRKRKEGLNKRKVQNEGTREEKKGLRKKMNE